jgi:hypothetical protein
MKFTLEIDLGNDAMQTGSDVAAALRRLAVKLSDSLFDEGADHGRIMDLNGNKVGTWEVSE